MLLLPPWDAKWAQAAPKGCRIPACTRTGLEQGREGAVGAAPHSTAHTGPRAAPGAGQTSLQHQTGKSTKK